MSEQNQGPMLDVTTIEFPSDRLTVRDMRRMDSHLFAGLRPLSDVDAFDITALAMCSWEHLLAHKEFARQLGLPDPDPKTSRAEIVEILAADYEAHGLSTGTHASKELVGRIVSAARAQAAALGRNGGRG